MSVLVHLGDHQPTGGGRRTPQDTGLSRAGLAFAERKNAMSDAVNPSFLGKPDAIFPDLDNEAHGPHLDVIHRLSATDTLKTRVDLEGNIISQEFLENELKPYQPSMGPPPIIPW